MMNHLARLVALGLGAGALLVGNPASTLAAQEPQPCPFTSNNIVSPALGSPVQGFADAGTAGTPLEACEFGDFTLYHLSGSNGATLVAGLPGLALNPVLALPPAIAAQVAGLSAGQTISPPGYQIAALTGLGDAALWVKDMSFGVDALLVQRGAEVFVFQVLDRPDAQALSTAVARAVVANAPAAAPAGAPSGGRPAVLGDCGLDAANAVADRLQRADVVSITVIGGCHYVAIATTLDGGGFANASTAQQICDTATAVAYSGGILGITLTDLSGHERASGADGQPCSAFP